MKVLTESLLKALKNVKDAVSDKEVVPQSNCFIFKDNTIYAFNNEMLITYPFELPVTGAINAKEFFNFISHISDKEIDIETKKDFVIIKGKSFKGKFKFSEIIMDIDEIKLPQEWKPVPDDFKNAINHCLKAVAKNSTNPLLECILWKENYMLAIDNFKCSMYTFDTKVEGNLIVFGGIYKTLLKYELVEYSVSEGWLHFKDEDGMLISVRSFDNEEFVDGKGLIEKNKKKVKYNVTVDSDVVLKSVLRAEAVAKPDVYGDYIVNLEFKDGKLYLSCDSEFGRYLDTIEANYNEDFTIKLYTSMFKEVLNNTNEFHFDDELSVCLYYDDKKTFLTVVAN